jgi:cardiolipin synthase A/B
VVEGGSTNLNFSSLVANWEIDLVAEDEYFGALMEEMFEEDLTHAREVRLSQTGRYPRARPERPMETADYRARRSVVGSGSGGGHPPGWVSAALQNSSVPINTHEQAFATAASAALLGSSLLAARFPRLLAWPLAATGALVGGLIDKGSCEALR